MPDSTSGASAVRRDAVALYTFLKQFTELRTETVRTLDSYEQVIWLNSVPKEPGCHSAAWHRGQEAPDLETWLEIKKPRLIPPPEPPADLKPWLAAEQWEDAESELPELRDEIILPPEDEGEPPIRLTLAEHAETKTQWERYVEERWWPWRDQDRKGQAIQRVYTDLFRMYQKQQRLGEQYEVVLGLGVLKWRLPSNVLVERHLIVANAAIRFEASRGVIGVGPSSDGARPTLEQDMLDPGLRPSPDDLRAIEEQVTSIGDGVWDPVSLDAVLASWVHSASPQGRYEPALEPVSAADTAPKVHLAPAPILRRRSDRSFIRAFKEVIEQLQSGGAVPEGVARFVTVADAVPGDASAPESAASGDEEIYFPLEANDEQRRVVERLRHNQGVLVQGPPGTGKSHTIVNLISHLLATGQRVLVTSHTPRALKVLKRYIEGRVPEIGPLAVLLLGEGPDALQAMEDSVQGITERQNHWDPRRADALIEEMTVGLSRARAEEAQTLRELRSIRERETYRHAKVFERYNGTLAEIAGQLRSERDSLGWVSDSIAEDAAPPLSNQECVELLGLLRDRAVGELEAAGWALPDLDSLLDAKGFSALASLEASTKAHWERSAGSRAHPGYIALRRTQREARQALRASLEALFGSFEQVAGNIHVWARQAAVEILGGHDRTWRDRYETTSQGAKGLDAKAKWADENPIKWQREHDHRQAKADAEELLAHLQAGGHWGFGPFRAKTVKKALYLTQDVRIGGRSCDTPLALRDLIEWLTVEERLTLLRKRWTGLHRFQGTSFAARVAELLDVCELLGVALALQGHVAEIRKWLRSIPGVPEPSWHVPETVKALAQCADAVDSEERLRAVEVSLSSRRSHLLSVTRDPAAPPQTAVLLSAFDSRDGVKYGAALDELSGQRSVSLRLARRDALLNRLRAAAPGLCESIRRDPGHLWDSRAPSFEAAWSWARAQAWIARLSDPGQERQLRLRLDGARTVIRKRLAELASLKAWRHCFARMTEHERQHLVAWAKSVRAIGKGTGKYAPVHRRNAREHMNECRTAIPAWVMPLYRVAETIRPGAELFDVAIIDEASQSGPEALLLPYLARRLVVVGDDKQISPTYLGIDRSDVNILRQRHLAELPHGDAYGVDHSFFDIAEIRYPGRIRLQEHFRCMPEIIQFSNKICYHGEPLIPLRQYGGGRLAPVVGTAHVADGYLKGTGQSVVNPPEAEAVATWIEQALASPTYKGKSFGVISLLAEGQAREIEKVLLQRVGPEEMDRRQLVCGDAYAFQGDERDVVVLSMVSAPDPVRRIGVLTTEPDRRRFNVAASRARDQMLLFHSVTLNDLSPKCFRYALLEYCLNPTVSTSEVFGRPIDEIRQLAGIADRGVVKPPDPFESWFEVDVFLRIAARDYRVLPQYEVAGYRIDLVVEGMANRIAVECDGDFWHGPERHEQDVARQRVLERCGWEFCRIRGSAFAFDPDRALDDLWVQLERSGARPGGAAPDPHQPESAPAVGEERQLPGTLNSPAGTDAPTAAGSADSEERDRHSLEVRLDDSPRSNDPRAYREWRGGTLPDPAGARGADLVPGLLSIIGQEGPMTVHRVCRLFVKAAGGQRVGKLDRLALHRAIRRAAQEGHVVVRNEGDSRDFDESIVRTGDCAAIVIRRRGPRDLTEVPPSEIAAVIQELTSRHPNLPMAAVFREILVFYETRRMTVNIEGRLRWIESRRESLLARDADDGRQRALTVH